MISAPSMPPKTNVLLRSYNQVHDHFFCSILISGPVDIRLILLSRFMRMFAYGAAVLILAFYLEALGFSDTSIGLFFTLTLIGDAAISFIFMICADIAGRRNTIALGGALMMGSGVLFTLTDDYWLLVLVATLGVITPSAMEVGPVRAIEEATIAQLTSSATRSTVFAWYTIFGMTGGAFGSLFCGWFVQHLSHFAGWDTLQAYKAVYWIYSGVGFIKSFLTFFLGTGCEVNGGEIVGLVDSSRDTETEPLLQACEPVTSSVGDVPLDHSKPRQDTLIGFKSQHRAPAFKVKITERTWHILLKLLPLFAIDSFAGGMVPFSLIALFIERKFHPPRGVLGAVMSSTWFLSAASNFLVPTATLKFGYVRTMVYTHFPASIFLLLLAFAPTFWVATVLIAARASLSSMDQGPRSSFLSAIVTAKERNEVMGLVNVAKTASLGLGPIITGIMATNQQFRWAFAVSGGLKCIYDAGLYAGFRGVGDESDKVPARPVDEEEGSEDQ